MPTKKENLLADAKWESGSPKSPCGTAFIYGLLNPPKSISIYPAAQVTVNIVGNDAKIKHDLYIVGDFDSASETVVDFIANKHDAIYLGDITPGFNEEFVGVDETDETEEKIDPSEYLESIMTKMGAKDVLMRAIKEYSELYEKFITKAGK